MPLYDQRRAENEGAVLKAAPRVTAKKRPVGSSTGGVAAELLNLQRLAGNRAVVNLLAESECHDQPPLPVQRVWWAEKATGYLTKKVLVPQKVSGGQGPHKNLKINRGRGGRFNTGFWQLEDDADLELHVHFGDGGGLVAEKTTGAHHFKRAGETKGPGVTNRELKETFGSTNVNDWRSASYKIR
jgi:hypothetical protein